MQQLFGLAPAQAGISDGNAMLKSHAFPPRLFPGMQVAFEHEAHDGLATFTKLPQHFMGDETLAGVIFLGIVMRTVDHDRAGDAFSGDRSLSFGNILCFVVRSSASAAKHDMAVGIAHGFDDGSLAVGIDANEVVWGAGGSHGIDGDMEAAFSAVLKTNRHGHATGHFSMRLAFGCTGTDRRPADEVGDVLWTDGVQQFRSAREAQLIDLEENRSGQLHPRCDIAGPVEMRVIDQAFPSDCGAWLFKICPHHDQEAIAQSIGHGLQFGGIFIGRSGIMDGARADDYQKTVSVLSMEDSTNGFSGFNNEGSRLIGNRKFGLDGARGGQRLNFDNMLIVDGSTHDMVASVSVLNGPGRGGSTVANRTVKVHTGC